MTSASPKLAVHGLNAAYGRAHILFDLALDVRVGEAVALVGATPVFADVDAATFNLDPANLEGALAAARRAGLKPKAVMTVDLFGLPAAYDAIAAFAAAHGLVVIADAAQSFGAVYHERRVGTLAPVTGTAC